MSPSSSYRNPGSSQTINYRIDSDPRIAPGLAAEDGALCARTDVPGIYCHTGPLDTDWTEMGSPASISSFAPDRVLFVAKSWPAGSDPARYFTNINTASVAAAALTPTNANPVCLYIFPGTYSENVDLTSNVHIFGGAHRDVSITGNVTWSPGVGINAPQTTATEEIFASSIRIVGTFTYTATGKTSGVSIIDFWRCSLANSAVNVFGRAVGGPDIIQLYHTNVSPAAVCTFDNVVFNACDGAFRNITFTGITSVEIDSFQCFGAMIFNTPGRSSRVSAVQFLAGSVTVTAATKVEFTACYFEPGIVLNVAAGAAADARMSVYGQNSNLAGLGTIDRTIWRTTVGPTVIGANVVPITPPLPNGNYNVAIELTAAVAVPFISLKTGANFTLTDAVGGNTFNLTVMKE